MGHIVEIVYDEVENCFYGEFGERIMNLFDFITPNDLFLFMNHPGKYTAFPLASNRQYTCLITVTEEEAGECYGL